MKSGQDRLTTVCTFRVAEVGTEVKQYISTGTEDDKQSKTS